MNKATTPGKGLSRAGTLTMLILGFAVLITAGSTIALVWPYNEFTQEAVHESTVSDGIRIGSDTGNVTAEGYPIVTRTFTYDVETCNGGVDLYVEKWLDSYGHYTATSEIQLEPTQRTGSIIIAAQIFYVPEPVCNEGTVTVEIPERIGEGIVYRFRVVYTYRGNFMKDVSVTKFTELFFLQGKEDEG